MTLDVKTLRFMANLFYKPAGGLRQSFSPRLDELLIESRQPSSTPIRVTADESRLMTNVVAATKAFQGPLGSVATLGAHTTCTFQTRLGLPRSP